MVRLWVLSTLVDKVIQAILCWVWCMCTELLTGQVDSVGHPAGALVNVCGFFDMVDLRLFNILWRRCCFLVSIHNSSKVCNLYHTLCGMYQLMCYVNDLLSLVLDQVIKRCVCRSWYWFWALMAVVEALMLCNDGALWCQGALERL